MADEQTISAHEADEVARANASGKVPVVFVHGLWLLASSWDRWAAAFEEAGYVAVSPGWPDDPDTVEEAAAHPEVFAHKSVGADRRPHRRRSSRASTAGRRSSGTPSAVS